MEHIAVHGGFLEIRPDVVTVLAQSAERASIDRYRPCQIGGETCGRGTPGKRGEFQ